VFVIFIYSPIIFLYGYQNQIAFDSFDIFDVKNTQRSRQVEVISKRLKTKDITNRYLNLVCYYARNT
jgi:hypothetical protein